MRDTPPPSGPPPDQPQESDPPDLRLTLVVVLKLLNDLEPALDGDLLTRMLAVRAVVKRQMQAHEFDEQLGPR